MSQKSPRSQMELQGPYLAAMQEISSRLMDSLPGDDHLWQTLAQTEILLLESQRGDVPLREVFGAAGVAGFCQSIIDEDKARRRASGKTAVPSRPASRERLTQAKQEPKGEAYIRKRRATVIMTVGALLLCSVLACWYLGIFNFLLGGSSYYLDELYNFDNRTETVSDEPITITLPLERNRSLDRTLFTDAQGGAIVLTDLDVKTVKIFAEDDSGREITVERKRWYIRMTYPVDASFTEVSYTEPVARGTVTLTLADGTTHTATVAGTSSGPAERGYEFTNFTLIELPTDLDTAGATITVTLDPPHRVIWERTSLGRR